MNVVLVQEVVSFFLCCRLLIEKKNRDSTFLLLLNRYQPIRYSSKSWYTARKFVSTCSEVFQYNFVSKLSDDNCLSSLSKLSCFDFLISFTTLFHIIFISVRHVFLN